MTNSLDLNKMGLDPMNTTEIQEIDGGVFGLDDLVAGLAVGLVISAIDHWSDIKQGAIDAVKSW